MAPGDARQLTITLTLTADEEAQLEEALGASYGKSVEHFLSGAATVSAEMFLDELLGRAEYPAKVAARQTRVMKLVVHAFDHKMPTPKVLGALFHMTPTAAATLLSATSARYATALKTSRESAVRDVLLGNVLVARWPDKKPHRPEMVGFHFHCKDVAVIATMREWLADTDGAVAPLVRNRDATNIYDIHASALAVIVDRFGLSTDDVLLDTDAEGDVGARARYAMLVKNAREADRKAEEKRKREAVKAAGGASGSGGQQP